MDCGTWNVEWAAPDGETKHSSPKGGAATHESRITSHKPCKSSVAKRTQMVHKQKACTLMARNDGPRSPRPRQMSRGIKATERIRTVDLRFTKPQNQHLSSCAPSIAPIGDSSTDSSGHDGAELAAVVGAWPSLPEHIRDTILTLVESSMNRGVPARST